MDKNRISKSAAKVQKKIDTRKEMSIFFFVDRLFQSLIDRFTDRPFH